MTVSSTGDLVCSYCGSKSVFTDKDLSDYKNFRYRMLAYLSAISDRSDPEETDMIWKNAEQEQFILADGRRLSINYLFKGKQDDVTIYTARRNVIFVFPKGDIYSAGRFQESTVRLDYPSADIKGLSEFFPLFSGVPALPLFLFQKERSFILFRHSEACLLSIRRGSSLGLKTFAAYLPTAISRTTV